MPQMKIGQFYDATVSASDGSAVANLAEVTDQPVVAFSIPDAAQPLVVRVTAIAEGSGVLTYSAPGFNPVTEAVTVVPKPTLVVADGPVQG